MANLEKMKKYFGLIIMLNGLCINAQIDLVEDVKIELMDNFESQIGERISSGNPYAYETPKKYNLKDVHQMAVYPGCEKFMGNNAKLNECLVENISTEVISKDPILSTKEEFSITLDFLITKEGKIFNVNPVSNGNRILEKSARNSLMRLSTRMRNHNILILPAKSKDGENLDLQMNVTLKKENP